MYLISIKVEIENLIMYIKINNNLHLLYYLIQIFLLIKTEGVIYFQKIYKIIKYLIYQLSSNNITFEARTKKQRVSLFESDEEEMISTKAKRLSRFKKPKKGMSSTSI